MTVLPHLASRLFGVPLAIHRPKLDVIVSVLGARIGVVDLAATLPVTPTVRAPVAHPPHIAVIAVHGTLVRRTGGLDAASGLTSYAVIAEQLDAAISDPAIAAILLDVDSPGGESGGVFDLADRIRAATQVKPVWAVANEQAFSAAYAIASAATRVFVARTGGVGSIGVIAMHLDQSAKDAKDGVRYTPVFAGARKNDLTPHAAITDEAHAVLRAEVERLYDLFVDTVARHRGLDAQAVRDTEAGQFFGAQAVDAGLADAVGGFDAALAQLSRSVSFPAASRGTGLVRSPALETPMTPEDAPAVPVASVAADVAIPNGPTPAATPVFGTNEALEIAQICTLANRANLIAGFLETQTKPAEVRRQLLSALAEDSPEISSHITPGAGTANTRNPLIAAAKRLAGVKED